MEIASPTIIEACAGLASAYALYALKRRDGAIDALQAKNDAQEVRIAVLEESQKGIRSELTSALANLKETVDELRADLKTHMQSETGQIQAAMRAVLVEGRAHG